MSDGFLTAVLDDPTIDSGTFTVTRRSSSNDGHGRRVLGAASTFEIDASVQPVMDGRVLEQLAEAAHGREVRLVITATAAIAPVTPEHDADQLAIGGETWTVISAEPWSVDGETWTKAYVARENLP